MRETKIVMIPVEKIFPHRDNPRKDLGDLTELSESIRTQGVLQNLTVVPWDSVYPDEGAPVEDAYVTVIGHRRTVAAKMAGLEALPCVITEMDYKTQVGTMLLETLQRNDLTVIEQAQGFQMMMDLGSSVREISEKTGFGESTVHKRLQIAKLDKEKLKEAEKRGGVTLNDYVRVAALTNEKERNDVLRWAGTSSFSYYLSEAEKRQKIAENKKIVKNDMQELGIEKYDGKEKNPRYTDEWDVEYYVSLENYSRDKLPKDIERMKWTVYQDYLYLVVKAKRKRAASAPKKSKKEKEADERRAELKEKCRFMRDLRYDFIMNFSAHEKYKDVINKWLLFFAVWKDQVYTGVDTKIRL